MTVHLEWMIGMGFVKREPRRKGIAKGLYGVLERFRPQPGDLTGQLPPILGFAESDLDAMPFEAQCNEEQCN
jgi:hypothetical protein